MLSPGSISTVVTLEYAAALVVSVLAGIAFWIGAWRRALLHVEREAAGVYRESAVAQRARAEDLEQRLAALELRLRKLEADKERTTRQLNAARNEIEQFERIVRLIVSARSSLPFEVRRNVEALLGQMMRRRDEWAQELFAWDQTQAYLARAGNEYEHACDKGGQ